MRIGIDFGTSYSAAAAVVDGALQPIRFDDALQFRTAVFFPEQVPDPEQFQLTPALEAELTSVMASMRRDNPAASEAQRTRDAMRVVRRQWLEQQARATREPVRDLQQAVFGHQAVEAYLLEGTGNLIESPKSMFGYKMDSAVRKVIVNIAAKILEHIRLTATQQLEGAVRGAVIGRPVEFRSSMGAAGGEQALSLLTEAAMIAGFDDVQFLEEPAAAAMHYHLSLTQRQPTLIVDIGGGTTDLAYAELGGAQAPLIHRSWGLPRGGTDLDAGLNLKSFMPYFGKDCSKVPVHHFVEAASVHVLPKQREFRRYDYRLIDDPYRQRLQALQQLGATTRLNHAAEQAKIALGEHDSSAIDLSFIDRALRFDVGQPELLRGGEEFLTRFNRLLEQVAEELPVTPASVFLTGGSSRSPLLQAQVRAAFPNIPVVAGEASLAVVGGLAVAAA